MRNGEMAEVTQRQSNRRILKGTVVSTAMNKTAAVMVVSRKRHPRFEKIIKRSKKYLVHDEKQQLRVGDMVSIREVRPLSKRKRFILHEIIERAK
jgi:small subunit ribosomal protein S17